jgi:hypothetical protein
MVPFADPVVDWATLGKVVAAALVAGIGVTAFFSVAILGTTRSVELRRNGRAVEAGVYAALGLFGGAVCVAAIVLGIIVMTTK